MARPQRFDHGHAPAWWARISPTSCWPRPTGTFTACVAGAARWTISATWQVAINDKNRIFLLYGDLRDTLSIRDVVVKCEARLHLPSRRPELPAHQLRRAARHDGHYPTSRVRCASSTRCASTRPSRVIHVCATSEVFGRVPKEKLPINEECTYHPASPYAISKVGTGLVGRFYAEDTYPGMTDRDHAHVYRLPVRAAPTSCRIDLRQSDPRDDREEPHPAGREGRQPAVALRTVADVRATHVRACHMLVTISKVASSA